MKKTLIALAVAASAVVSGSAVAAWTPDGNGGVITVGGSITPENKTPWEVWLGSNVQNLNSTVVKGESTASININESIPVLGIRTVTNNVFSGGPGISPQINYGQAVDVDGFSGGISHLNLDIKDKTGNAKIGSISVPFAAAALASWSNETNGNKGNRALYAEMPGDGFFGGLGKGVDKIATSAEAVNIIDSLNAEFSANYNNQGVKLASYGQAEKFSAASLKFSGYYGAGILAGSKATITLDTPAGTDNIEWTATFPISVSYQ